MRYAEAENLKSNRGFNSLKQKMIRTGRRAILMMPGAHLRKFRNMQNMPVYHFAFGHHLCLRSPLAFTDPVEKQAAFALSVIVGTSPPKSQSTRSTQDRPRFLAGWPGTARGQRILRCEPVLRQLSPAAGRSAGRTTQPRGGGQGLPATGWRRVGGGVSRLVTGIL